MAKFQCYLDVALIYYFCLLTSSTGISKSETIFANDNDLQLRLVSAVFRHGDRTIDKKLRESYPTDPYKDNSFYPVCDGDLTNAGKRRAYELGLMLRERYNSFLGDVYYPPNVYAHSTWMPRSKMTLQLVLAGLYPPVDIQKWNSKLAWQPIDLIYNPPNEDNLLLPIYNSTFHEIFNDILQSPEVIKKIAEFNDLMEKVANYTGRDTVDFMDLVLLHSTLYVQSHMELNLPEWTQNLFPNGKLSDAIDFFYELLSYKQLNNLNGGILLKRIIDDMNEINGTNRKINLFSAHDITVAALLHALNIYDHRYPAYTSSVIIELHENSGNYFVKVLHYLGIPSETKEISIPGCEVLCPYNKFLELMSNSIKIFEQSTPLSKNPKIDKLRALLSS